MRSFCRIATVLTVLVSLASISISIAFPRTALLLAVPPPPSLERPIVDTTNTLSSDEIAKLAQRTIEMRQKKSLQIAILMIPTLDGEDLDGYSLKVARQWGVGDKSTNNGIVILVVKNERRLKIEVGTGQEGNLTDARAARIIRNSIAPAFAQKEYYNGLNAALIEIENVLDEPPQEQVSGGARTIGFDALLFGFSVMFIILSWLVSILERSKSWWAGGVFGGVVGLGIAYFLAFSITSVVVWVILALFGFIFDYIVSKNYKKSKRDGVNPSWWAGGSWGGGSGSGRGGGSFGGGGFSGGGASGS